MAEQGSRGDELIGRTEEAEARSGGGREMAAANLFDLRRIIGGLFVLYGIVLTVMGIADTSGEVNRSAGIRINLWMGLGMLVFGLLMLAWAFTRPLGEQLAEAEEAAEARPGEQTDHPVPRAVDTQSLESEEGRGGPPERLESSEQGRGRAGHDAPGARRAGDTRRE